MCVLSEYMLTCSRSLCYRYFFFFNDTATTEIYTLSLHDALPISHRTPRDDPGTPHHLRRAQGSDRRLAMIAQQLLSLRSEEHTSELQSRLHIVCRLLLEKKTRGRRSRRLSRDARRVKIDASAAPP